jgi:beta-lactam-binding protein with PASTA domain
MPLTVFEKMSTSNGRIEVPSLEGIHIESGLDQLIVAGFVPKLSFEPTEDPSAVGCVLETVPEGGSPASKGAAITVVVGHQPRALRDIEAVNIAFEARLTEVGIPDDD